MPRRKEVKTPEWQKPVTDLFGRLLGLSIIIIILPTNHICVKTYLFISSQLLRRVAKNKLFFLFMKIIIIVINKIIIN